MSHSGSANPPYFDVLFQRIADGDDDAVTAFGHHVHWGYWQNPATAEGTADDYQQAAERMCQRICNAASVQSGSRIADIGCGFGGTIASLNHRYSMIEMSGVNIDPRQLHRASEQVVAAPQNSIRWICADAAALPFEDASFDILLAVECIFHFDRKRFLAEAARVLRPGGRLALSDFVPDAKMASFIADGGIGQLREAIAWTYGQVDMTCSLLNYEQLGRDNAMRMIMHQDVTSHTLPTYDFLEQGATQWQDRQHAQLFQQATRWLRKASAKQLIQYQIIAFEKL